MLLMLVRSQFYQHFNHAFFCTKEQIEQLFIVMFQLL
jgi:hypothetical protein